MRELSCRNIEYEQKICELRHWSYIERKKSVGKVRNAMPLATANGHFTKTLRHCGMHKRLVVEWRMRPLWAHRQSHSCFGPVGFCSVCHVFCIVVVGSRWRFPHSQSSGQFVHRWMDVDDQKQRPCKTKTNIVCIENSFSFGERFSGSFFSCFGLILHSYSMCYTSKMDFLFSMIINDKMSLHWTCHWITNSLVNRISFVFHTTSVLRCQQST